MSDSKEGKTDWAAIIFLLIGIPLSFTFGGAWLGLVAIVIGVVVLGWSKRHDGPFTTNKEK